MSGAATVHDIKSLVRSFHSLLAIETVEEERVTRLLHEAAGDLGLPLFEWSITQGLHRVTGGAPIYETTDALAALRHVASTTIGAIWHFKDFGPHVENASVRRSLRELASALEGKTSLLVLSGDPLALPREIEHHALVVELGLPNEKELLEVIRNVVMTMEARRSIVLDLTNAEMRGIVRALSGLTLNQARQTIARAVVEDGRLDYEDISLILARKGALVRSDGLLEFYPPADNRFELAGLDNLKRWLQRAKVGFSERARAMNLRPPRGVLIVGVQGCGKSLAAKFIAREWQLPLLKLDAGRLYDKYVGESEKNFRRATRQAEAMAPAVLWIDEIEKAFGTTEGGEGDGGLSRRILGTLLTWLQEKSNGVFVVGAANDLMSVPPELLRKGRFDEIFFVDLPTSEERRAIFDIHLRLRNLDPATFDLERLVELTEGFSGAEIEQGVIAASYAALHRNEPVSTQSIAEEVEATVPLSVSRSEDVARIRQMARERFVPAS